MPEVTSLDYLMNSLWSVISYSPCMAQWPPAFSTIAQGSQVDNGWAEKKKKQQQQQKTAEKKKPG